METPNNLPPVSNTTAAASDKKKYLIIGAIVIVIAIFFFYRQSSNQNADEQKAKMKEPLFHRDEPVKPQIFQGDYKEKVREMLDSGRSVMQISKETGIRIDVVRKIKKQKEE